MIVLGFNPLIFQEVGFPDLQARVIGVQLPPNSSRRFFGLRDLAKEIINSRPDKVPELMIILEDERARFRVYRGLP